MDLTWTETASGAVRKVLVGVVIVIGVVVGFPDGGEPTGLVTHVQAAPQQPHQTHGPLPDGPVPSVPETDPSDIPTFDSVRTLTAQQARDAEYWLDDYDLRQVWEESTGEGVKIAVIDTGVDGSHPDLQGALGQGTDVSGVGAANGQDGLGAEPQHGTMVASVAAGRGHGSSRDGEPGGGTGVIGVAPGAEILPVSTWLGSERAGVRSTDEQIPDAVRWAVDNGADIINMSVGSPQQDWPESWDSAFEYAEEEDVLIVAAAGNRGSGITQVGAPATIPNVFTVSGVDRQGNAGQDSSSQGSSIAVAAPAEDLVGAIPGGRYREWTGTSAAAPIVSGTAALIMQKHPDLSAQEVAHRITASARDAGEEGRDPLYGYGVLDIDVAVNGDIAPMEGDGPLGSMSEWIQVHRKQESTATQAQPQASVTSSAEETTASATAPTATRALDGVGALPVVLVVGFGVLIAILTVAVAWHIRWLHRNGHGRQ